MLSVFFIIELMCSGQSLGSRLTVSRAQTHNIPAFIHVLTDTWTGYPPSSRVWNRHKDQQGTLLPTKIVETREQSDLDDNVCLTEQKYFSFLFVKYMQEIDTVSIQTMSNQRYTYIFVTKCNIVNVQRR